MNFQDIFENDGLYTSDSFTEGFCFKIENGTLYGVQYKDVDDLFPTMEFFVTYKGLFSKKYKKVLTIRSLFKCK